MIAVADASSDVAEDSPPQLRLFMSAWAFAAVFDQFYDGRWIATPIDAALTALALGYLVARPGWPLFLAFVSVQTISWLSRMPAISNHLVFAWIVDLMLLVAAVAAAAPRGPTRLEFTDRTAAYFRPAAQAATVLLYGFVVLHKLNTDFVLNTRESCAVTLYERLSVELHVMPSLTTAWMREVLILIVLGIEASVPLLLLIPGGAPAGIALGTVFHAMLVPLNPDFSVYMIAAYTLFMTDDATRRAHARIARVTPRRSAAAAVTAALLAAGWLAPVQYRKGLSMWMALACVVPAAAAAIEALVKDRRRLPIVDRSAAGQPPSSRAASFWLQSVPLGLLVFFGISPYIGFRTEGTFSMFSNLATEGTSANHLFMPRWHVFDYQDDLVEVLSTDGPGTDPLSPGRQFVYYSFANLIRSAADRGEDFGIEFSRNGHVETVPSIRQLATRLRDPAYVERKLVAFRPVWPDRRCAH
jgi:hypothetical protein